MDSVKVDFLPLKADFPNETHTLYLFGLHR